MSKTTKKKHVTKEVLGNFVLPENSQQIAKNTEKCRRLNRNEHLQFTFKEVLSGKGNNLHEVETMTGETFLASMPTKFRKNVWIKRGDFVILEPIEEGEKVKAEIVQILYKEQIKYIKEEGKWPSQFEDCAKSEDHDKMLPDSDTETDNCFNVNRTNMVYESESDSDED